MEEDKKLSLKKRISILSLLLIIKIVEPTNYSSDYSKELEEMKKLLLELI
jgi:hypothetical protein